jgi:hypothetical protein
MAGDPQLYSATYVTINGKLLAEEASVSIDKKSGLNPVYTVAKGFAGMSVGASSAEWTIESAAPSADFEFNPDPFLATGQMVEVGAVMSGRQMTCKMFITDASYNHSVNAESKLTMKLMGPMKIWE